MNKKINLLLFIFLCGNIFNICRIGAAPFFEKSQVSPYIPPVINTGYDNFISPLIDLNGPITKLRSNSYTETYSVAKSSDFIGFTDLIKYKNKWFASFRISDGHVAKTFSGIIVLESSDLIKWEINQIFKQENYDLRDPKFVISGNTLRIHFHSTNIKPTYGSVRNDFVSVFNNRAGTWSKARKIGKSSNKNSWFWRISYNQTGRDFYTISYINGLKLHRGRDANSFKEIYSFQNMPRGASEGMISFYKNSAFALIRTSEGTVLMQSPMSNLQQWQKKHVFSTELGGPNFLIYDDKLIISGRDQKKGTMVLFYYDINTENVSPALKLPSNAETGYSGMYIDDDKLFVSYYNCVITSVATYHIYLSTIDLPSFIK